MASRTPQLHCFAGDLRTVYPSDVLGRGPLALFADVLPPGTQPPPRAAPLIVGAPRLVTRQVAFGSLEDAGVEGGAGGGDASSHPAAAPGAAPPSVPRFALSGAVAAALGAPPAPRRAAPQPRAALSPGAA
jgi:hypothetical protein